MHFQFKARLGTREISILVSKDMSVQEMLDALSYALQLSSFSQIVGFRDPNTGLIIPPSIVCSDPDQIIKNETYEVMIRQIASQAFQSSLGAPGAAHNSTNQSSSNPNTQLGETQASFQARMGTLQQVIGTMSLGNATQPGASGVGGNNEALSSYRGAGDQSQQQQMRSMNQAPIAIRDQMEQFQRRPNFADQAHQRQPSTAPAGVERERPANQYSQATKDSIISLIQCLQTDALLTDQLKIKIIQKVQSEDNGIMGAYRLYMTDRDLEGFKARIIHKFFGGHLGTAGNNTNLTLSAEERQSSMTTAGFNRSADYLSRFSRGSTGPPGGTANAFQQNQGAPGGANMRPSTNATNSRFNRMVRPTTADDSHAIESGNQNNQIHQMGVQSQQQSSQDRYLPIIINLESSNLLDEQTSSLLKTLILEENLDVFRLVNSFIARAIDEQELCVKLIRLAQQMGTYMERPVSPIPKNKKQLLQFVNSLTRYHFNDKEDIELLNKLIQEENEFVLSCFDVFDSDKDHENLIDSLQRILDKSKDHGLHYQKIMPSAFYQNYENGQGWPINSDKISSFAPQRSFTHQTPQPNHSFGLANQLNSANVGPFIQSHAALRPETSHWNERPNMGHSMSMQQSSTIPYINVQRDNIFNSMQHGVRSQSFAKSDAVMRGGNHGGRMMHQLTRGGQNPRRDRSVLVGGITNNNPHFKPQPTTVHNVALIPGYFSSGEEDNGGLPSGQNSGNNPYHYSMRNKRGSFQHRFHQIGSSNQRAAEGKYAQQEYGGPNINLRGNFNGPNGVGHYSDDRGYYRDRGVVLSSGPKLAQVFQQNGNYRQGKNAYYVQRQPRNHRQGAGYQFNNFILDSQDEQNSRANVYSDSHQLQGANQLDQQQLDYLPRLGTNFVNSQIIVDDYGDEIYGANLMGSHMSHNVQTATFFSDSKNHYYKGGQQTMGKKPKNKRKHKRNQKQKKAKHTRKKYSSEDELSASFDENDDFNQRANIGVGQSNYRNMDQQNLSDSSKSSDGSSQDSSSFDSSSSSEGASASQKLKKEDLKNAKKLVKKAEKAKKQKKNQGKHRDRNAAKNAQQDSNQLDYQKIIADEKLAMNLRIDNYAILLCLTDNEDSEVQNYFHKHMKYIRKNGIGKNGDGEQSSLLSELLTKTEETYQAFLEKHLTHEQQAVIRGKRSMKDEGYQNIFRNIINQGPALLSIEQLMQDLSDFAQDELRKLSNTQNQQINQYYPMPQNPHNYQNQFMDNSQFPLQNQGNHLMQQPEQLLQQHIPNKEKLEHIFLNVLYNSFKGNEEKEKFLRIQFEQENQELMQILNQNLMNQQAGDPAKATGAMQLKAQMNQFVQKHLGPDFYKNLKDAINGLFEKGHLQERDRDLIRDLSLKGDKHLLASWDTYTVMKDEEDLADTLQVLCDVKREKNSQKSIRNEENEGAFGIQVIKQNTDQNNAMAIQETFNEQKQRQIDGSNRQSMNNGQMNGVNNEKSDSSFAREEGNDAKNNNDFYDQSNQPSQFQALFVQPAGRGDYGDQEVQNESSNMVGQHLQPRNSPQVSENPDGNVEIEDDDDGMFNGDGDQEYNEDIDGIMQFQHKILRKYGMLGMIHFQAIPFFHQLVNDRDYKMICIFEVFAQNRNEDDFLENLGILNDMRLQSEEQQNMQQEGNDDMDARQIGGSSDSGHDQPLQENQFENQQPMTQMPQIARQVYEQHMSQPDNVDQAYYHAQQRERINDYAQLANMNNGAAAAQAGKGQPQINHSIRAQQQYNGQRPGTVITMNNELGLVQADDGSADGAAAENAQGTQQVMGSDRPNSNNVVANVQPPNDQGANIGGPGGSSEDSIGVQPQNLKENEAATIEDPNMQIVLEVKDKLKPELFDFILEKLNTKDKKVLMVMKCFKSTKDEADMINSMQRLYNKSKK